MVRKQRRKQAAQLCNYWKTYHGFSWTHDDRLLLRLEPLSQHITTQSTYFWDVLGIVRSTDPSRARLQRPFHRGKVVSAGLLGVQPGPSYRSSQPCWIISSMATWLLRCTQFQDVPSTARHCFSWDSNRFQPLLGVKKWFSQHWEVMMNVMSVKLSSEELCGFFPRMQRSAVTTFVQNDDVSCIM